MYYPGLHGGFHTTPSSWVFQGTNIDFTEEELENGATSAK